MKKLTRAEKSWILYDFANSSYGLIVMTVVLPIYYKNHLANGLPEALSTAEWGVANSIGGFLVAILAPLLGAVADAWRFKKVFLVIFLILGVVFTGMLSFLDTGMRFTALTIYVISLIGFSGSNVFYDSMLVDVTVKKRMDWISGLGYGWGYIGGALPFLMCIGLILVGTYMHTSLAMEKTSFIITAVWWAVFSIPLLMFVRQKYVVRGKHTFGQAMSNILNTFKQIRQYKNVLIFLGAYFLYIDGVDTIIRMAIPYGQEAGVTPRNMMISVLCLQFLAFPFALLYGRLGTKFGAKPMLYVAICVYAVITFCGYLMPGLSSITARQVTFYLLSFLIATSQGGIQALSRSFYSKLIPKEQAAQFFGFYNIFGKFATIIGPLMIALAGYTVGDSRYGILSIMFLFLFGGWLLTKVQAPAAEN
ncbi:MFS transporter [Lentisphaerota bacterium ZTH]|nr:MFS transporter [Lentisphaerota bacterium]WET07116.1 MFS transporter [Lentisphaerota bacterium ZTH]